MNFRFRQRYAALALVSGLMLSACSSDSESQDVATGDPAGAETTMPATAVTPEQDAPPGAGAPPVVTSSATPTSARDASSVAKPDPENLVGPRCDLPTIAKDVGEAGTEQDLVLDYCNGSWAHVSQANSSVGNWLVRSADKEDDPWAWLEVDGRQSVDNTDQNCFNRQTIEAHRPVPEQVWENVVLCQ